MIDHEVIGQLIVGTALVAALLVFCCLVYTVGGIILDRRSKSQPVTEVDTPVGKRIVPEPIAKKRERLDDARRKSERPVIDGGV